jgi:drug/metabolite transporter (DMT)-like permease
MELKNKIWLQYCAFAFGVLCIGWSAIFVKLAGVNGFTSAFYRMFIASMVLVPFWLFRKKTGLSRASIIASALCGFYFACDLAVWNTSIMLSKAAIATLLANMAPVWVGVGSIFIFKEKLKPVFLIGSIITIFGVVLVLGISNVYQIRFNFGNILAICASFFYAAYLLTVRNVRNKIDTISFTAISMITSSIVLYIVCTISGVHMTGFSTKSWLSFFGLGLITQLGGWIAINWALKYIKPTAASVSLLSQSVITAIVAIPVLGEVLSNLEILGIVIVLFGIFLVNRKKYILLILNPSSPFGNISVRLMFIKFFKCFS